MPQLGKFGKILISWSVLTVGGVLAFVVSKRSVDRQRIESMQIRERMRKANVGDYEITGNRRFEVVANK